MRDHGRFIVKSGYITIQSLKWKNSYLQGLAVALLIVACSGNQDAEPTVHTANGQADIDIRPNVLVVVLDDAGFNDCSIFGSEINTPNIDGLARDGVDLTICHTAATCSPTSAMLMFGTDNHFLRLGSMAEVMADNQKENPEYVKYLNSRVAELPELFQEAG